MLGRPVLLINYTSGQRQKTIQKLVGDSLTQDGWTLTLTRVEITPFGADVYMEGDRHQGHHWGTKKIDSSKLLSVQFIQVFRTDDSRRPRVSS